MKTVSLVTLLLIIPTLIFSQASIEQIENHFTEIVQTEKYRNYRNVETLDTIAEYIKRHFDKYADSTYYQNYMVDGNQYKNVVSVFGIENSTTIVIGAHYDVCGNQDGADDNASGVIGILELARMLKNQPLKYRVELVGYTLEEPPFFRTENMGSYQHAKSLHDDNRPVFGMISLDMIGYFSSIKKSQSYPIKLLSWFYGNTGDFIMVINKWGKGKFARQFTRNFKGQKMAKVKSLTGPSSMEGLDWSDHLNYWTFGYSASMITDTAAHRNKNYHNKGDTIETINVSAMAKVIDGLFGAIVSMR